MNSLADWQSTLTGVIDAERADVAALGPLASVPGPSAEQGCAVYRNNSRGVRGEALSDVYPVCRRLVGDRSFDGLVRRFVRSVPSKQGDLNRFGGDFAGFVAETVAGHESFAGLPWLVDLVRLEWLCHSVYYREDDPPLDLSPLQAGDPSSFCPRPATRLARMHSPWPVHEIWQAHQGPGEPATMQITPGDRYLVIERRQYRPRTVVVDAVLWSLLDACARGMTLGEMGSDPDLDMDRLGELVRRQWIGVLEHRDHAV